jgi:hypothetical protein
VVAAVEFLRSKHGDAEAHKLALLEQKRARRARSRKRFDFWVAVAAQLNEDSSDAVDDSGASRQRWGSEGVGKCSDPSLPLLASTRGKQSAKSSSESLTRGEVKDRSLRRKVNGEIERIHQT